MFLSDKLIEIGANANPKNNYSQNEAAKDMFLLLNEERKSGVAQKKLLNITEFAIKELVKLGFTYYTIELFFEHKS